MMAKMDTDQRLCGVKDVEGAELSWASELDWGAWKEPRRCKQVKATWKERTMPCLVPAFAVVGLFFVWQLLLASPDSSRLLIWTRGRIVGDFSGSVRWVSIAPALVGRRLVEGSGK